MVDKLVWTLPRPRPPYYHGGFPLHFEKKLIRELGNPRMIFHPFGGMAEHGYRLDINSELKPDIIGDAHNLPFANDSFDLVIVDPPYNDELSKKIFGTGKIKLQKVIDESVRICKPGCYVAFYHWVWIPMPKMTDYYLLIVILFGQWHRARICTIYRKWGGEDYKTSINHLPLFTCEGVG